MAIQAYERVLVQGVDYQLGHELGSSQQAIVFKAVPKSGGIPVAVKIPRASRDGHYTQEVLLEEIRMNTIIREGLARNNIDPKHLSVMIKSFLYQGKPVCVFPYVDGLNLESVGNLIPESEKAQRIILGLYVLADVARGLSKLHKPIYSGANGRLVPLVHRDVKPKNIMVTRSGKGVLLDHGAAKTADTRERDDDFATLHYMSPEQAESRYVVTPTDVFSLGMTLFEVVTSKSAFGYETLPEENSAATSEITRRLVEELPHKLSAYAKGIPATLDEFVNTMLAKNQTHRPTSEEVVDEFMRIAKDLQTNYHITDAELFGWLSKTFF